MVCSGTALLKGGGEHSLLFTTKTDAKFHVKGLSKIIFCKCHRTTKYTKNTGNLKNVYVFCYKVTYSDYVLDGENLLCVESFKVMSLYKTGI
jgi:hypothetical protein